MFKVIRSTQLSGLILLILVGVCDCVIQAQESASTILNQFERRLADTLGHLPLTPEIDTLVIEPEDLRDCDETVSQTCYPALTAVSRYICYPRKA